METRELVVTTEESGERLDVFLTRRLPDWSRSGLQRLIRSGFVRIGSSPAPKPAAAVAAGDRVVIQLASAECRAVAEELPLEAVYEDDDLVVINKPAGMTVHPGAGITSGTIVNALLFHLRNLSSMGGEDRPGIVHRLDKMTSGLMLIAKNDVAHRRLAAAFKAREIQKTYIALVHGRVARDEGVVDLPIGRDPIRRTRMKAVAAKSLPARGGFRVRDARTSYRVLRRFTQLTLLEAVPHTGRTHQIRVHLASLGYPVVGDTLYGAPSESQRRRQNPKHKALGRTFLHASALTFRHPRTGQSMHFELPLPEELQKFLDAVGP